jgi:hypothetical protein
MRCILITSMLASVVLLAETAGFAQNKQSDAVGAEAASPDMWEAHKKMWEGKWETTINTPDGEEMTGNATVEVILGGRAMLRSSKWTYRNNSLNVKSIMAWCPRRKAIVSHSVNSSGGRSETVITLVNGVERSSSTSVDADGTEDSGKSVVNVIDQDTIKVAFVEGRYAGSEFTWKRTTD